MNSNQVCTSPRVTAVDVVVALKVIGRTVRVRELAHKIGTEDTHAVATAALARAGWPHPRQVSEAQRRRELPIRAAETKAGIQQVTDMSSKDWHAEGAQLILDLKRIDRYFAAEFPSTTEFTVEEAADCIAGLLADNARLTEQAVSWERAAFMADEDRKDERARAEAAEASLKAMQPAPFTPFWPPALRMGERYRVLCDDKGRNGGTWLDVFLANDGDVHVSMQDWEKVPEGKPDPFPSLRVRTYNGGGRNERTRQALLWLAEAIRLDTAPRTITGKKSCN